MLASLVFWSWPHMWRDPHKPVTSSTYRLKMPFSAKGKYSMFWLRFRINFSLSLLISVGWVKINDPPHVVAMTSSYDLATSYLPSFSCVILFSTSQWECWFRFSVRMLPANTVRPSYRVKATPPPPPVTMINYDVISRSIYVTRPSSDIFRVLRRCWFKVRYLDSYRSSLSTPVCPPYRDVPVWCCFWPIPPYHFFFF